jgi:hypothetical protein
MENQMEKILGGPIGLGKEIPGTVVIEGKEFVYFLDNGKASLREQFKALTQFTNPPNAKNGGVNTQGARIILPDDSTFYAIAYHGDIVGWRKDIQEGAEGLGVLLGKIESNNIAISDGRSIPLSDCKVVFG